MLQSAIDYIEAHLLDEIHYEEVAQHVHMSPYEFHRTFSFISGITINTYIRNRRLSLAGQELLQTNCKVIDLAMKYGFDSADGFTKAFQRFHGVSPSIAREKKKPLVMYNPLSIHVSLEGGKRIDYRIQEIPKRKFLAVTKSFPVEIINEEDNEEIANFWSKCYEDGLVEALKEFRRAEDTRLFGLCAPLVKDASYFDYGIGILLENQNTAEEKMHQINQRAREKGCLEDVFKIWEIDDQDYVIFECHGTDGDCITKTWEAYYKEFLPQSGYRSSDKTDFEIYDEKPRDGVFCEVWIPVDRCIQMKSSCT